MSVQITANEMKKIKDVANVATSNDTNYTLEGSENITVYAQDVQTGSALETTLTGKIDTPSGGSTGQVLKKTNSGTEWAYDTNTTYTSADSNNHSGRLVPGGGSSGQVLKRTGTNGVHWAADNNTTYSTATRSANGIMAAADKVHLDTRTSNIQRCLTVCGSTSQNELVESYILESPFFVFTSVGISSSHSPHFARYLGVLSYNPYYNDTWNPQSVFNSTIQNSSNITNMYADPTKNWADYFDTTAHNSSWSSRKPDIKLQYVTADGWNSGSGNPGTKYLLQHSSNIDSGVVTYVDIDGYGLELGYDGRLTTDQPFGRIYIKQKYQNDSTLYNQISYS